MFWRFAYLNVAQFDNQKYSNQKTTDGSKLIFDSGYSYYPVLYFKSCSADSKIFFENLLGSSAYRSTARNITIPLTISGSSTIGYPLSASYVKNIFNTIVEGSQYFAAGTINNFPSYSVQETGDHTIQASFDLSVELSGSDQSATWSFQVFKNNDVSPLYESEYIYTTEGGGGGGSTVSRKVFIDYTVSTSPSNTIEVSNSTNSNTVSVAGQSKSSIFISVPSDGSPTSVTFTIDKTAPTPDASDSGTAELTLNAISVDSFPITLGSPLFGNLTANINNTDGIELNIFEG